MADFEISEGERPINDVMGGVVHESRLAAGVNGEFQFLRGLDQLVPARRFDADHADDRVAGPLIDTLVAEGDLLVGDNEPYSGKLQGDCMWTHGTQRGLPHALIELRQDLIRDDVGQAAWAERIARVMRKMANRRGLAMKIGSEDAKANAPESTRNIARGAYGPI